MRVSEPSLLTEFQVAGHQDLYVIGSFDRKTSLYYQQVRALNLIWLLEQAGRLAEQPEICILGGGIAGVTAAAALLRRGQTRLTLLEKGKELLALQRHSQRPIHPHIYSWPEAAAANPAAGLPLLDWQAGISAEIAAGWAREFEAEKLSLHLNTPATALDAVKGGYRVAWREADSDQAKVFPIVILAMGVGVERSVPGLPLHSYWEDDSLLQTGGRILVSGCGEGGLLEVLRLRLQDFQPDSLLALLAAEPELGQRLLSWEAQAAGEADSAAYLSSRYLALDLPDLDQALKRYLLPGLKVTLHGPHPDSPLNMQGTILNRLLVSRLLKLGDIAYSGGMKLLEAKAQADQWLVSFADGSQSLYDAVLIRHGASSSVKKDFASLWEQAMQIRSSGSSAALLKPLWPQAFYQQKAEQA